MASHRRILIVDEQASLHDDLQRLLCVENDLPCGSAERFDVDSAFDPAPALALVTAAVCQRRPYALAFVDAQSPPHWAGIETARRIWQIDAEIQLVVATHSSDGSWDEAVATLGHSDRFLVLKKPLHGFELRQLVIALTEKWRLAREVRHQVGRLEQAIIERTRAITATRDLSVFALAKLAESRDADTGTHLERMRGYSQLLAEQLRFAGPYQEQITREFLEDLYRSSPLHDIGKVGIPDAILLKPGRLTPQEFDVMRRHAAIGAETLDSALRTSGHGGFLRMAADIARYHHERWDGTGYPQGLRGEVIPLAARIVALADVFDALTTVRVYKTASTPQSARDQIVEQAGRHFDPAIVEAFDSAFPAFVRLHTVLTAVALPQRIEPQIS